MKRKIFSLFVLLCLTQSMMAQLTSLGVIEDSLLANSNYKIEYHDDYLYAASSQGLYRYDFNNVTNGWEKLAITDSGVVDFEVRGDTIIVLTDYQLYTSTDGCTTTIDIINPNESEMKLTGFAVHPSNTKKIHVVLKHGLLYTEDGGTTWMAVDNLMLIEDLTYNPLDEKNLIAYRNNSSANVYVSTNGGFKWEKAQGYWGLNRTFTNAAFHPVDKNRIVMCGYGIYAMTTDQGYTWTTIGEEYPNPDLGIQLAAHLEYIVYDPRNPEILYGADWTYAMECKTPILRSKDGGLSWETIYTIERETSSSVYSMCIKDNLLAIYAGGKDCEIYLLDVDAIGKKDEKPYLVTEGKEWAVYHNNPICSMHYPGTVTYRLEGDTVINGKTYKKEWYSRNKDLSDMQPTKCYMREEDGKVYRLDGNEEALWFDYKAEVGDTINFNQDNYYGRIKSINEQLVGGTDSIQPYMCYEVQMGVLNNSTGNIEFKERYMVVYEGLGVMSLSMNGYGLSKHIFNIPKTNVQYSENYTITYGCAYTLLCVHDNDKILYQTHEGCYKEWDYEKPRPTTRRGYGIYYGDSYLYKYLINEAQEVTDSTDFAVWNDKTVIYFDVDTVGTNAFTNVTFRRGQILYFTEKLNCIMPDAFTNILMLDDEPEEENPFGDLCIVFSGDKAPSIDKSSIIDYADTTYRITYVVSDLEAYIASDIQWTYTQLVTIDDFVKGYISPENKVTTGDATEIDVDMDGNATGNMKLAVSAKPKKDIPVRIGDGENKDIYSRAPAWMRYTVELKITDSEGTVLYEDSQRCSANEECQFNVSFTRPANGIVLIYSRSIDQFDRASEWSIKTMNLNTGIDNTTISTDAAYYDLMGRKVAHPTRGIYIKDGQKVMF